MAFSGLPPAVPLVKSNSLKALAVTGYTRVEAPPNVPTSAEQGVKGQEAETLLFVLVPAGTPQTIINQLSSELRAILAQSGVKRHACLRSTSRCFSSTLLSPSSSLQIGEVRAHGGDLGGGLIDREQIRVQRPRNNAGAVVAAYA